MIVGYLLTVNQLAVNTANVLIAGVLQRSVQNMILKIVGLAEHQHIINVLFPMAVKIIVPMIASQRKNAKVVFANWTMMMKMLVVIVCIMRIAVAKKTIIEIPLPIAILVKPTLMKRNENL